MQLIYYTKQNAIHPESCPTRHDNGNIQINSSRCGFAMNDDAMGLGGKGKASRAIFNIRQQNHPPNTNNITRRSHATQQPFTSSASVYGENMVASRLHL